MFKETLENKFQLQACQTFFVVEEIKKESFMTDPVLVELTK